MGLFDFTQEQIARMRAAQIRAQQPSQAEEEIRREVVRIRAQQQQAGKKTIKWRRYATEVKPMVPRKTVTSTDVTEREKRKQITGDK